MHLQVVLGDLGSDLLQSVHERSHTVHALTVGDEHRVFARDHHEVLDPEQAHQRLVGGGVRSSSKSTNTAVPREALPAPSLSARSQTACHEPTSDQP